MNKTFCESIKRVDEEVAAQNSLVFVAFIVIPLDKIKGTRRQRIDTH